MLRWQANASIIERKKHMMDADKEENARIARYIRERDEREEAASKEAARVAHERELETARLRAQQEKQVKKRTASPPPLWTPRPGPGPGRAFWDEFCSS